MDSASGTNELRIVHALEGLFLSEEARNLRVRRRAGNRQLGGTTTLFILCTCTDFSAVAYVASDTIPATIVVTYTWLQV